jgi:hypothetical protein
MGAPENPNRLDFSHLGDHRLEDDGPLDSSPSRRFRIYRIQPENLERFDDFSGDRYRFLDDCWNLDIRAAGPDDSCPARLPGIIEPSHNVGTRGDGARLLRDRG